MSLELCVLGSGSAGNCTVVRSPWGVMLIDAGFGPRVTEQQLHDIGLSVKDISAIVLTHLDHDHFNFYWLRTILKHGIQVYCARKRLREFLESPEVREVEEKLAAKAFASTTVYQLAHGFDESFEPVRGVRMEAIALAHDRTGSHGFVMECDGYRVGFATDLGHVPQALIERFCGVDVLALESNYDPEMERNSDRPWILKQRIMGGSGHLSNEQAFEAIQAILDRTTETCGAERLPRHIVLLHRSRQCNCPDLLRKLFASDPRISPALTLTHQHERTAWLSARQGRTQAVKQLALAWA